MKKSKLIVSEILAEERKLLKHFEPSEDKWDRRLLFEVTVMRMDQDEF